MSFFLKYLYMHWVNGKNLAGAFRSIEGQVRNLKLHPPLDINKRITTSIKMGV